MPPTGSGSSRKISFNVSEQYDIQDVVGEGAYGVVWYDAPSTLFMDSLLTRLQLRAAQALGPEGGHQEDYAIRPFHVLLENTARDEAASILQPREHHFHS